MSMNRVLLLPALLTVLVSATACDRGSSADAPGTAAAPRATQGGSGDTDSDMAEISDHRLTMAEVERWYQAQRSVYEAMRKNPALAQELERESESDELSLDDIEDRFGSVPAVRKAIEATGLEVRDFGVILYSLAQAAAANAAVEMGASRDSVLARTGVHPANLDFVRAHKATLDRLQKETAALAPEEAEEEDGGA